MKDQEVNTASWAGYVLNTLSFCYYKNYFAQNVDSENAKMQGHARYSKYTTKTCKTEIIKQRRAV